MALILKPETGMFTIKATDLHIQYVPSVRRLRVLSRVFVGLCPH